MRDYEPNKMKKVHFTGIRRVLEKANKMEAEGRKIIHFESGQPDFATPQFIKDAAITALEQNKTNYTSNYGTVELRKAIAKKLEVDNGLQVDPMTEIMVTVGGEEAMAATILALVDVGDEVLVSDPGYSPYESMIKIANGIPVKVPLSEESGFNYNLEELEKRITDKTKLLIFCTPGNPTGTMMDKQNLLKLAEICEKHDLLVISDEAYEQVVYDNNVHTSFATLPNMRNRTITIHSFSKSYSMCGWRIGYLVACPDLMHILIRAHQNMVLSACNFAQSAATAALEGPKDEQKAMVKEFDKRRILMYEGFRDLGFTCIKPQAAFYIFPNIGTLGMDGREFSDRLLEEYGVAVVPGGEFGDVGINNIRISYATSYENCVEGMRRIKEFVEKVRTEKGRS